MTTQLSFSPSQGSPQTGELYEDAQSCSPSQGSTQAEVLDKDEQSIQNQKVQQAWRTLMSARDQEGTSLHAIVLATQGLQADTTLFQGVYQDFETLSTLFTYVVEERLIPSLEQQNRTYQEQLALVTELEKEIALADGQTKTLESTIEAERRLFSQNWGILSNQYACHNDRYYQAHFRYDAIRDNQIPRLQDCRRSMDWWGIWCAVKADEEARAGSNWQDTVFHREFYPRYQARFPDWHNDCWYETYPNGTPIT